MVDNPFLHDLLPQEHELIVPLLERVDLPRRSMICKQGGAALYVYFILRGNVALKYKPYDGPRITLTHLHAGDVFGWSAVVGNPTYTSDATSTTSVEMLRVRGGELRSLCVQHPVVGKQILEKLAIAVSPRWVNARQQVQSILRQEMLVHN